MLKIRVAAGVVVNSDGHVLLGRRRKGTHLADLWEFPGGKCEAGESYRNALDRELCEEIGIDVLEADPLIRVDHRYEKKIITLDIWQVTEYAGVPTSLEGQAIAWVPTEELSAWSMPAADQPVIELLNRRAIFK